MAWLRVLCSDRACSFNQWQRALYLNFIKTATNVRWKRVVCFFILGFNLLVCFFPSFNWLFLSPKAISEEECLVYTEIGYPVNPLNDSSLVAIPSASLSTNKRKKKNCFPSHWPQEVTSGHIWKFNYLWLSALFRLLYNRRILRSGNADL